MGASVIKIEDYKSGGDGTRLYPPHTADGGSAMYHVLNRGKKSVGVHLRSEEGVSAIRSLIEGDGTAANPPADVLVESFRPGILEAMMGVQVSFGKALVHHLPLPRRRHGPISQQPGTHTMRAFN